jgi:hypothetical protein
MQQKPWDLLVLGHELPRAMEAAASKGEPSLQVVGALGPASWHRLPGVVATTAGTVDQPVGRGNSGACLSGTGVQEPQELLQL